MPISPQPTKHFEKRIVYGWVYDGFLPIKNSRVKFILNKSEIGFTSDTVSVARPIYAPTDEDGYFEQELWCDEDSEVVIDWRAFYPNEDNQQEPTDEISPIDFSLSIGDGQAIAIGTVMKLGVGATPDRQTLINQAVYNYILALIDNGTIPSGGGGGGFTLEQIQDAVAAMLTAGGNNTVIYNDPAGTLLIGETVDVNTALAGKADKANVIRSTNSTAPTLLAGDIGKEVRATAASAKVVTVPATSTLSETFICAVLNVGAGALTFSPAGGVTLRNNTGALAQYKTVTIRAIGTNEYLIEGGMA